ncbi:MAG: hypothetical protein JWQ01_4891 [Massilia sp.]|nr:hypothetical protein [Massilia sp.]
MFVIKTTQDKTINWPCVVETAADGGKIQKFEFTGTFLLLDDDAKEAIVADQKSANPDAGASDESGNEWKDRSIDAIMKVMTGWKSVVDESKTPIEFSRESLRAAARSPQGVSILRAINTAVAEISTGARVKN